MMRNAISFASMEQLLRQLNFAEVHTSGTHRLYKSSVEDVTLVLPETKSLSSTHVAAIRKTLVEKGIIEPATFDGLLEELTEENAQHANMATVSVMSTNS